MKILLATSKAVPGGGGIASYNQEFVRLLGEYNDIYLLTDSDEQNVEGYKITYTTHGHSNKNYEYCKGLIKNINDDKYDVIINSASSFMPVIAPFVNSPIVSISHFVNGRLAINAGYNIQYQNAVIALSNYGKGFIATKFNKRNGDKIHVVYNFVDINETFLEPEKYQRRPIRIVYPGGTSIEKSVDVVQRLLYRLLNTDLEFEFIWIGGKRLPSSKMTLLGLHTADDLFKNDSRLTLTGLIPRNEAEKLIASANIFLLPSRGEGCPMTLLEAMRGGCIPVVSDAHHGSREIIENSKAGIIVKQGSSLDLFHAIKEIICDSKKYRHCYRESYDYLMTSLSPQTWKQQMTDILDKTAFSSRKVLELNSHNFKKSADTYLNKCRIERYKTIIKSAFYRIRFDFSFMKNLLGGYRSN